MIEAERAQIAHEIHDSVLPLLFAASASLSGLVEGSRDDLSPELRQRLEQTLGWIGDAMQVGRRMLTEIYPPELQNTTWTLAAIDTVNRLLGDLSKRVRWDLDVEVNHVVDPIALAAYRIVVESIRNALGHGGATEVVVTGKHDDREFQVMVRDNGSGFDPSQIPAERFGIRSMIGRAELVGGTLQIDTAAGGPTSVTFTITKADQPPGDPPHSNALPSG